jgi:uncharacterized protein
MVDEKLLELLVCPNCKGEVVYKQAESEIECVGDCKYVYPVVEGIPHMLIEEARKP